MDARLSEPSAAVAVITAVPGATAVMRPVDALTDAAASFREVHARIAAAGITLIAAVEEEPTASVRVVGSLKRDTFARGTMYLGARVRVVAREEPMMLPRPVHLS